MKPPSHPRACMAAVLMAVLLLGLTIPTPAFANSAELPLLTILVSNPPDDLSISVQFGDGSPDGPLELEKRTVAWESYYKLMYHMVPSGEGNLDRAVIVVQSGGKSFQCPLPEGVASSYNSLLSLHMREERLTVGTSPLRIPLLVTLRVTLTLLLEGLVFLLFGYRQKRSWLVFLIANLITQGCLNAMYTGPSLNSTLYWIFTYVFSEILVLAAELVAFTWLLRERGKLRAVLYTVIANAASLVFGGLLIMRLPV